MSSFTEENYLKAIYKLAERTDASVSTSALADSLQVNAASVTDFIKKMATKRLVSYQKSKGVLLTEKGKNIALKIIRKHRLWEVWLVNSLKFQWDEVHEIAEQLEHVNSDELIKRLDQYLGYPKIDPHGDLIPDANGKFIKHQSKPLFNYPVKSKVKFMGVTEHSNSFLQFLTKNNLKIGDTLRIEMIEEYDHSFYVKINNKTKKVFSKDIVKNLLVVEL